MNEPVWITREDCLAYHESLLERFGGLSGIREESLLDSALNRPKHLFAYGKPSFFQMAASYAHGIAKNYPFLDGNKRAGFIAAALFIETNGYRFQAPEEEAVLETLALAAGEISEEAYATWLERTSELAN
jgi:death-on-curing protein